MARQTAKIDGFQDYPTYQCRRNCDYYAITTGTCDYILITGRRRGCPCGKDCIRYRNSGVKRGGAAFNNDLAYNLWKQKKKQGEIAEILGVSVSTVSQWMRREKLKPNGIKTWDKEKARELYDTGEYSDKEIAEAVGVSESTIQHWRTAEELPAHKKPARNRPKSYRKSWDKEEAMRMYREGVPVKDIAAKFGVSETTVKRCRQRRGVRREQKYPASEQVGQ